MGYMFYLIVNMCIIIIVYIDYVDYAHIVYWTVYSTHYTVCIAFMLQSPYTLNHFL